MIDLIYNFINDVLIGDSTIPGKQQLAVLLTFVVIILFFFLLIKLMVWTFRSANPKIRR